MADEGGSDINWKELCVDKSIDVVLVPLGLFAALWLQGVVDDRKEREDYKLLLKDFQAEIDTNRSKAKAIEDDLGPIAEIDAENVLGPLQTRFAEFRESTDDAVKTLSCIDIIIDHTAAAAGKPGGPGDEPAPQPTDPAAAPEAAPEVAPAAAPEAAPEAAPAAAPEAAPAAAPEAAPAGADEAVTKCLAFLDEVEKKPEHKFKPIDLAPLYRYEVWQVYLASGIKLFKDPEAKKVGLKLGEVYSAAKEVEKRVEDIEKVFNDSFMEKQGQIAGLSEELEDLLGDFSDIDALKQAQPRLQDVTQEILEAKYSIRNVEEVVRAKSERLKVYVAEMNKSFDGLKAELEKEAAR